MQVLVIKTHLFVLKNISIWIATGKKVLSPYKSNQRKKPDQWYFLLITEIDDREITHKCHIGQLFMNFQPIEVCAKTLSLSIIEYAITAL